MPGVEHIEGALKFLTEITASKSVREGYYQHSNYIAEYFCTISNLGLFAVAFYYDDYATLFAATFSALSHAIPSQRLHDLDMLGVFLIFGKAVSNYKVLLEKPEIMAYGAGALSLNLLDTFVTRRHLDKVGPSIHVLWHLSAAFALYKFNQGIVEVTPTEIQSISMSAAQNSIPEYLGDFYNKVCNYISDISRVDRCAII